MDDMVLPLGKIPPEQLAALIHHFPQNDPAIRLGPGIGLDCAVLQLEDRCLVFKSEPITFVSDAIGWYGVQIACNDIVTSGALPRWMLVTMLLPEGKTTPALIEEISSQIALACASYQVNVIGGHTEVTSGLERPILNITMIGEVAPQELITPQGGLPGDHILLTQSIPIEGTAILAREFSSHLVNILSIEELTTAQNYLFDPGISVFTAARTALAAGKIHAMHDPTEGGLAAALHEMAQACGCTLVISPERAPVSALSRRICEVFRVAPLATIASGALLLAVPPTDVVNVLAGLRDKNIPCCDIGYIQQGSPAVVQQTVDGLIPLPLPPRDEIARIFEEFSPISSPI